jgi:CRP/FNR family transcriptional regulator, nitrogen fixation regulation protein
MLHWNGNTETTRTGAIGAFAPQIIGTSLFETVNLMGACMDFERDTEIFGENESADYIYAVVSGAVRFSKLMSDGRRQIGAFYLPGDLFGLEAEETHLFSAESIGPSRIAVVKRSALLARAIHDQKLVHQLWAQTAAHLQRAQGHMLLLGRKNAEERIAAFLLDMATRLESQGSIELPMSRQDIGDYLGLSIETVSRTLTQLERDGVISMPLSRHIVFRDRPALDELSDCWVA